jgi:hypothetical protein
MAARRLGRDQADQPAGAIRDADSAQALLLHRA